MKQTQVSYRIPDAITHQPYQASFKTTLKALPSAESHIHTLRDGEVVLYKRERSRVSQCKYKYKFFTGALVRVSTRKTNRDYAAQVVCDLYDEARYRERMGLTPVQKTFAEIARITVEELQRDLAAGTGKKIYVDYCQIINKYFVPFFGERHLHNIRHDNIAKFERWRNDKMQHKRKSSTLMNFARAFNRV
ncbi:hypothetical protein [Limnohabitans sp.]|uniref:hypothetical protein n=1 Tax=Limnohabitans sp. TaxID=1907725 RepID=UPI0038B9FB34